MTVLFEENLDFSFLLCPSNPSYQLRIKWNLLLETVTQLKRGFHSWTPIFHTLRNTTFLPKNKSQWQGALCSLMLNLSKTGTLRASAWIESDFYIHQTVSCKYAESKNKHEIEFCKAKLIYTSVLAINIHIFCTQYKVFFTNKYLVEVWHVLGKKGLQDLLNKAVESTVTYIKQLN